MCKRIVRLTLTSSLLVGVGLGALMHVPIDDSAHAQDELVVNIEELAGSGVFGDATLIDHGDGTITVDVLVTGAIGGHPIHIHTGTCESLGDIIFPLVDVDAGGGSVTEIAASLTDLRAMSPLAIAVHLSAEEIGTYIACGDIGETIQPDELPSAQPVDDAATNEPQSDDVLYHASSDEDFFSWQADFWIHENDMLETEADASGGSQTYVLAPYDVTNLDAFALEAEIRIPGSYYRIDDCPAYFGFIFSLIEPREGIFAGIDLIGDGGPLCPSRFVTWAPWIKNNETGEPTHEIDGAEGAIPPDTKWHTYRLEVSGNQIIFLIDGAEVFRSTDDHYALPGQVGVVSGNLSLEMRSFSIVDLSLTEPDETPATPPSSEIDASPEPTIPALIGEPIYPENTGEPWLTYENPAVGIEFQYPPDWQLVEESSGLGVKLIPPGLDPEYPVPFIAIAYDPGVSFEMEQDPIPGMSPTEPVTVGGVTGRRYEDAAWATPYQGYYIDLPYRDGTLFITAVKGPDLNLVPTLLEILLTLTIQP